MLVCCEYLKEAFVAVLSYLFFMLGKTKLYYSFAMRKNGMTEIHASEFELVIIVKINEKVSNWILCNIGSVS